MTRTPEELRRYPHSRVVCTREPLAQAQIFATRGFDQRSRKYCTGHQNQLYVPRYPQDSFVFSSSAFPISNRYRPFDFEACSLEPCTNTFQLTDISDRRSLLQPLRPPSPADTLLVALVTKKKYKPVALKTHPVLGTLPSKFCIEQNIIGDPLANIPTIPLILPPFAPRGRYTEE